MPCLSARNRARRLRSASHVLVAWKPSDTEKLIPKTRMLDCEDMKLIVDLI